MKKLLTVLVALSMVFGAFAADPVANVSVASFSGSASLTFGVDLATGGTGFLNETDASVEFNFFDEGSKSTTGDGIWGELAISVDATSAESDDAVTIPSVDVDTAKIHFGPVYVSILGGDTSFGGSFIIPNVLDYDDGDSDMPSTNKSAGLTGYDQGFSVGYANDFFSVEGALLSKPLGATDDVGDIESVSIVGYFEDGNNIKSKLVKGGTYFIQDEQFTYDGNVVSGVAEASGKISEAGEINITQPYAVVYKAVYAQDAGKQWTNGYGVSLYTEIKPIASMNVGLGGAYAITDETGAKAGDASAFAGVDFSADLGDGLSLVPAATYAMKYTADAFAHKIGAGLAFRWGESEDASSILSSLFGDKLFYDASDDNGDALLLPGVSVSTIVDPLALENTAIYANMYLGDVVENLSVAATYMVKTGAALPMNLGFAADYDIAVEDVTITPAAGIYVTTADAFADYVISPVVRVNVGGLIDNTSFSVLWDDAAASSSADFVPGELTIKTTISL